MTWQCIVLGILGAAIRSQAFGFGGFLSANHTDWNDLKVAWGINPFTSFISQPRTQTDAQDDGWMEMVSGASCDSNPHFKGKRFFRNNDSAVILLYDVNGYIAGIQAANMCPSFPHFICKYKNGQDIDSFFQK